MKIHEFEGRTGAVAYIHQQLAASLSHLDAKAHTLWLLSTAALFYLSNQDGLKRFFELAALFPDGIMPAVQESTRLELLSTSVAVVAAGLMLLALAFALWAIRPRRPNKSDSIIFFGGIVGHGDITTYKKRVTGYDEAALAERLTEDSFYLATIANRKFNFTARATRCLIVGGVLLVVAEFCRLLLEILQ